MALICHAYEHEVLGMAYTSPPGRVLHTRQSAAIGVPGLSRESIRLACPTCRRTPSIDRQRWARVLTDARNAGLQWLDVSTLGG